MSRSDNALFLSVLQKNLLYQRFLHHQVIKIQDLAEVNDEKRRTISRLIQNVSTTSTNNQLSRSIMHSHAIPQRTIFASPWFVDDYGFLPPENDDASAFLDHLSTLQLYPNYVAFNKRVPMTPYHYYLNTSSPIPLIRPPDVKELPHGLREKVCVAKISFSSYSSIPAQIIPKLEFISPRLTHIQYISLWRGVIVASYEFHIQQYYHLQHYQQLSHKFAVNLKQYLRLLSKNVNFDQILNSNLSLDQTKLSLEQFFSKYPPPQPPQHPFFGLSLEALIESLPDDLMQNDDDNDDDDSFVLPNPVQLHEYLTGVSFRTSLGLDSFQAFENDDYNHDDSKNITQNNAQNLFSSINHKYSKPYFDPNSPIDALHLLAGLRYSSLLDDNLDLKAPPPGPRKIDPNFGQNWIQNYKNIQKFSPHTIPNNDGNDIDFTQLVHILNHYCGQQIGNDDNDSNNNHMNSIDSHNSHNSPTDSPLPLPQLFMHNQISWTMSSLARLTYQHYFSLYHFDQFRISTQYHKLSVQQQQQQQQQQSQMNNNLSHSSFIKNPNPYNQVIDPISTTSMPYDLPPPPNSILTSFNTLKELNISTLSQSATPPEHDLSNDLVTLYAKNVALWNELFCNNNNIQNSFKELSNQELINNDTNTIPQNNPPITITNPHNSSTPTIQYPYPQIPLQYINFDYLSQHVVKNGSTGVISYCHAYNYREPFINEAFLLIIILYYYWFYEYHISAKYYAILNAHHSMTDPSLNNDGTINTNAPRVDFTELYQTQLDIVLTDQDLIDVLLCQTDLQKYVILNHLPPRDKNCFLGDILAVDYRIKLSFFDIFNLYTRANTIINNLPTPNQDRFKSLLSQSPIIRAWSIPKVNLSTQTTKIIDFFSSLPPSGSHLFTLPNQTTHLDSNPIPLPRQPSLFQLQRAFTMIIEPTLIYFCRWVPMIPYHCVNDTLTAISKHQIIGLSPVQKRIAKMVKSLHELAQKIQNFMSKIQAVSQTTPLLLPQFSAKLKKYYSTTSKLQISTISLNKIYNTVPKPFYLSSPYIPQSNDIKNPHIGIIYLPSAAHVDLCGVNINPDHVMDILQLEQIRNHQLNHPANKVFNQNNDDNNNNNNNNLNNNGGDKNNTNNNISNNIEAQFTKIMSIIHKSNHYAINSTTPKPTTMGTHVMHNPSNMSKYTTSFPTLIPSQLYRTLKSTDLSILYHWISKSTTSSPYLKIAPSSLQTTSPIPNHRVYYHQQPLGFKYIPIRSSVLVSNEKAASSLSPYNHFKWSFEEDMRLILAVKAHTRQRIQPDTEPLQIESTISWQDVAAHVPSRDPHQCRHRYLFVLSKYTPPSQAIRKNRTKRENQNRLDEVKTPDGSD